MKRAAVKVASGRWRSMGLVAASMVMLWPVHGGSGQVPQQSVPQSTTAPSRPQLPGDATRSGDQPTGIDPAKLEQMREEDRRKHLLADTAKLVDLSNQLKTDVEKASKDELSLDVVRKAAEIEKLAHDVKERMKS